MKEAIRKRLTEAIALCRQAAQSPGAYPFLPDIIRSLEHMEKNISVSQSRRSKMAGGLERFVSDNWDFSESSLGTKLVELANDFASMPDTKNE
jgi:hypothetical protein